MARRADEARDEEGIGAAIEVERRADLLSTAVAQDDEPVGHRHRLRLIVGDIDARGAEPALQALDLAAHLDPELGVEIGERLVEEEGRRLAHDGAAHGDPLALPARELPRLALEQACQLENAGRLAHPPVDLVLRDAPVAQPVGHVVVDAHVGIERVVLEHHGDVALGGLEPGHLARADVDLAGGRGLEAGDEPQQGRLAAAGGADDHGELAVLDAEIDAVEGGKAVGVGLLQPAQHDLRHGACPPYFSVSTRPLTKRRCMSTTTTTGGRRANTVVAMTRCHCGVASATVTMRWMPITIVA